MSSPVVTPAPKYVFVGEVKSFLEDLFAKDKKGLYKSFQTKITEAAEDPSSSEGTLEYNKLHFLEWKSGTENRIFGFFKDDILYICLAATEHKKKKYSGMTWDGQDEFDAMYFKRQLKPAQVKKDADDAYEAVKDHIHG